MYDLVFSLDLMSSLGNELSGRFLAHDEFDSIAARNLVSRIRLAKAELQAQSDMSAHGC
jgi:hypothetical protein